ncbi:hypothetical protein PUN28_010786 [Cardiocondyla obscurior]
MYFNYCDLPANNSLGEITQRLGATSVEKLGFKSFMNLSTAMVRHHLDDFENLKILYLTNNNASYVDKDLLANQVNLTLLNLLDNNLQVIDSSFFNHTPNLKWLELGLNALQSIEMGTFDNLKNLTFLNLWSNHLTTLQSGIFDELVALNSLDLNSNNMVELPENVFAKLENLSVLNLFRNNFTDLPRDLLRNNVKLQTFRLYGNKRNMSTLPNGFFANLTELKQLELNKNGFITLPEDLFWGCTSLINIILAQNRLRTLPVQIFRDLKTVASLQLNSNHLEYLPDYVFQNANKLEKLDLSKNKISSISTHLFDGLNSLKKLSIDQNHLTVISSQGFRPLNQLKIANLSDNYLTLKQSDYQDEFGRWSPFRHNLLLEELYLANNSISEIFSDWILSDIQLRKLDLKHNNISYISAIELHFVSNEIEVDLTHNKIRHIIFDGAEILSQSDDHRAEILVNDNPLHCDCTIYNFLRYIEGRMHPKVQRYFYIVTENLTCQSPSDLKNISVSDLKSKTLTCSYPKVCSEKCNCRIRPEDKTFIYDCSNRNLTSVPSDIRIPPGPLKSESFEVDFSGNQLTQMPDLEAIGFKPLKKLILSHNLISEISLNGLSNTIKVLELHSNNISEIRPDVFEFLKQSMNLTRLTLHKNPWKCECENKDFLSFIQMKLVKMPDLLKVTCSKTNISVSEMTMDDFCPLNMKMMIGISVAISLAGLLIGVFGLLYYKYQQQIKVWLFAHQLCLWFVTEEELDKEKLYDAFVSFSNKDHDFVVNELVSKLENGPSQFKLCVHYRDWLAGAWISENIFNSVKNSRRTIVVLSPNFLESVWGKMEFRTAHSEALSEGRARVILILYGDIGATEDLDPELKAYISMNTYVKWGDPWFWDKLRYALPHRPKFMRNTLAERKICMQVNEDKKELYPAGPPETPPSTTPPVDALKKFICDKDLEERSLSDPYIRESSKLNEKLHQAIILSPDHLMKSDKNNECLV